MPLKQFFTAANLLESNPCRTNILDDIDWNDADVLINKFKEFVSANQLGPSLGYVLDRTTIDSILRQDGKSLDAIKFYLAYSPTDKTIRLVPIACQYDPLNNTYNDYNIPVTKPADISTLPVIANTRPCPPRCGETNFINL